MKTDKKTGDTSGFDTNWKMRKESHYTHWTKGEPQNQIQLAFRSHWNLFNEIFKNKLPGNKILEVGCGRASLSAYFSDQNYEVTCLDYSQAVLDIAIQIYDQHNLKANFVCGDALNLPFEDNNFDLTFSIGLLEHFENFDKVISEQHRVLKKGGLFLGYVVPEQPNNIQKDYNWINEILRLYAELTPFNQKKEDIYRSDIMSGPYLEVMNKLQFEDINSSGVYPLPMISPSISFPFTLMPEPMEKILVKHFTEILNQRNQTTGKNPWLCEEKMGQAFLIWGWK